MGGRAGCARAAAEARPPREGLVVLLGCIEGNGSTLAPRGDLTSGTEGCGIAPADLTERSLGLRTRRGRCGGNAAGVCGREASAPSVSVLTVH